MYKLATFLLPLAVLASCAQSEITDSKATSHATMDHSAHQKVMADSRRHADVSTRGKEVMPFSLAATTHYFSRSAQGGVQQVVAKQPDDIDQVALVRLHLQDIRAQFLKGDYTGPSHIHGADMPGLAELQAAKPGQIAIEYAAIAGGAALTYKTQNPSLVAALHTWFDAQLADHGDDARAGHAGHSGLMKH